MIYYNFLTLSLNLVTLLFGTSYRFQHQILQRCQMSCAHLPLIKLL